MSNLRIERGDIFYINKAGYTYGSEQQPGRPGIIVSNNQNNQSASTVEVVYCTTKEKPSLPTHMTVLSTKYESTVLCEQITTVSVDRLGNYIGKCNEEEMKQIDLCLLKSLSLNVGNVMNEKAEPNEPSASLNSEVIELRIERDIYKRMYESVMDRLTGMVAGDGTAKKI